MNVIVGMLMVCGSVIGGYVLSKGELLALFQPYEVLVICGAAFGAFVISNPTKLVVDVLKGLPVMRSCASRYRAVVAEITSDGRLGAGSL